MPTYEKVESFRFDRDDLRRMQEIIAATGLTKTEALRLALEMTPVILDFAVQNDPKAVLVEQQYERGRIIFLEKMSREEIADLMLYVRERIGSGKFDALLRNGQERRAKYKRDEEVFTSARDVLMATFDPPYTFEQIVSEIQRMGNFALPYAKEVFDRMWRAGDKLVQTKPGKYSFVQELKRVEETIQ